MEGIIRIDHYTTLRTIHTRSRNVVKHFCRVFLINNVILSINNSRCRLNRRV